ncbi:UbiA prenyltransferase family protein [Kutzneria sp. CA-103260]|uniref:UbiA prenyltransferase family protein n=1 Tax=Kutzneria sp. CA-103260 TaxID=2802641 RepID=UPI001BAB3344|nr:UbiA family prenyltransferase [Kutzneria sp. CA-103260]QUQ63510.1 1,4-dihydroxy-2-naphthoate octaprenyltransferase [Kutzneria sp. CA-103260]
MSTVTTTGFWPAVRRVHRLEYPFPLAYACHGLWGAAYAVATPAGLLNLPVLLAVVAAIIPIIAQNPLNAGQDIRSDSAHPGKHSIAVAARRLGVRRTLWWSGTEFAVAILLAALAGSPLAVSAVTVCVLLHLAYNLEPIRLKRRGFANPLYFGLTFGFLPFLTSFAAARADLPGWAWLVGAGFGGLMAGRTLWWAVPDRDADAAGGDRTLVVWLGARRAWLTACLLTATGIAVLGWGVWLRLGPAWALVALAATGLFLVIKLRELGRVRDDRLPSERRMRLRTLTVVTLTDTLVTLVPLIASMI